MQSSNKPLPNKRNGKHKYDQSSTYWTTSRMIIWATFGLFTAGLLLFYKKNTEKIVIGLIDTVRQIQKVKEPYPNIIFFFILLSLQLLFIPIQSTFGILMTMAMSNFLRPMLLMASSSILSSSITFFIVRNCCRGRLTKKFEDKPLYKLVIQESKESPWRVNAMVRLLYIPAGVKNTVLPLSEVPFLTFFTCSIPFSLFYSSIFAFVGLQLKEPEKILKKRKFKEKEFGEKVELFVTYFLLFLSFVVISGMWVWSRRKLREIEAKEVRGLVNSLGHRL